MKIGIAKNTFIAIKLKDLKVIKRIIGIVTLAFLASWFIGFIQINGATFDIKDANVITYWDYDEVIRDPHPIIPSRSRQIYEAGYVGLRPDFEKMLNDYLRGETIVGISSSFNDGKTVHTSGTDYDICIYPSELSISKTNIKPFHNKYLISDKNNFEFEGKVPYYGRHRYYQSHSVDLNIELEVNGILSKDYLDYKLKEIYLYYMLDAVRQHVQAEAQFLKHTYLDTMKSFMFVKDNYEIEKDEFLKLDPKNFVSMDWLPSRESMNYYTDDEDCRGVLIATSK